MLGAGKLNEVMDTARKLISFGLMSSIGMGLIFAALAPFIPYLYNTEQEVRHIATQLMVVSAVMMPFDSLAHSSYFTIRSGGKSLITFIFDCGFMWAVQVPLAFCLSRFTDIPILSLFIAVQIANSIKGLLGIVMVKKVNWIKNIVD